MVKVDLTKCIGCGSCYTSFPDIFEPLPDGKSKVKDADHRKRGFSAQEISDICPVQAISAED